MKTSVHAVLRSQLGLHDTTPPVCLAPPPNRGLAYGGPTVLTAFSWGRKIAELMVHPEKPQVGQRMLTLEGLQLCHYEGTLATRCSVEVALLARCSEEELVLVSDAHGVTADEVAMWKRFSNAGFARITQEFKSRAELVQGQTIYDGRAIAPPILVPEKLPTLIG